MINWLSNLCNCWSPSSLQSGIISYLSSSELNWQSIEQQKCTEQLVDYSNNNIKQQSEFELEKQYTNLQPNWYPNHQNSINNQEIIWNKFCILEKMLQMHQGFYKIYDSGNLQTNQTNLTISAKQQQYGTYKLNIYKFQSKIPSITLKQYNELFIDKQQQNHSKLQILLKQRILIQHIKCQNIAESDFNISQRIYNKLLVINEHYFLTCQGTITTKNNQIYSLIFSIDQQKKKKKKNNFQRQNLYQEGWIHLCGIKVKQYYQKNKNQNSNGIIIQGYLNLQLTMNKSINHNMLKQPICKEIRKCMENLTALLKNDSSNNNNNNSNNNDDAI